MRIQRFPRAGAESIESKKGILVAATHPVTLAVSPLCDGTRACGLFFCAPGFSSAENLGAWARNW